MVKAEYMGDGAVDPGELAHHREGVVPVGALAAEGLRDCQRQQAAATQGIALGLAPPRSSRSTAGLGKLPGQFSGDGQGRAQGAFTGAFMAAPQALLRNAWWAPNSGTARSAARRIRAARAR